jgi:predicted RNA polymerase sigma factor
MVVDAQPGVDHAGEAIRLARQLAAMTKHEEVAGLMLHHARRPARTAPDGRLVPPAQQDRGLWNTRLIAAGVDAARQAPSLPERDHLTRQAARLNAQLRS